MERLTAGIGDIPEHSRVEIQRKPVERQPEACGPCRMKMKNRHGGGGLQLPRRSSRQIPSQFPWADRGGGSHVGRDGGSHVGRGGGSQMSHGGALCEALVTPSELLILTIIVVVNIR
jgi:hypothetical protein